MVSRQETRPSVDVTPWTLRHRLPTIGVPLLPPDEDINVDLQDIMDDVYNDAGYDAIVNYDGAYPEPA